MTREGRQLGLGLQTDKRPGDYGPLARLAEDAGFDVVTTFNDLWFQPALPALLEIAAATTRVRIGPSCLNPFTVHPVEIAGQIAVLDAASDGRAFLGLARGTWLEPLGLDQSDPVTVIRETWEIVRRLLAGDDSGFMGRRFSLPQGQRLRFPVLRGDGTTPRRHVGATTLRLRGRGGSGVESGRQRESGGRPDHPSNGSATQTSGSCSALSPSSMRTVNGPAGSRDVKSRCISPWSPSSTRPFHSSRS